MESSMQIDPTNLEMGRLETFAQDWPYLDTSLCSKERMSKAGFYFTGKGDIVRCFVCQIKLEDWNPETDDPRQKHLEAAPTCEFARVGKEEGKLTVEQWLDMFCDQAIHKMELKFKVIEQMFES